MENKKLNEGQAHTILGQSLGLGFISPEMASSAVVILLICFPFAYVNPARGFFLFICLYCCYGFLVQNNPGSFFEKLSKPKNYISIEPEVSFDKNLIPELPKNHKKTKFKLDGKIIYFKNIEYQFNFKTYGQIELEGKEIGLYVLERGIELMFIFCWRVSGFDPSINVKEAESTFNSAVAGLDRLPSDIDLKIIQDINSSSIKNSLLQKDLLDEKSLDRLTEEIIRSRGKRGQELAKEHRMQTNDLLALGKYRLTLGSDLAIKQNLMDSFIAKTQPIVGLVQRKEFNSKENWEKAFDYAYHYAYKTANNILSSEKFYGWQVRPFNVHELYARDYLELHDPPIPKIPQYTVYNENGLQDPVINHGIHSLATIFAPKDGNSVIPLFENSYLYLPEKQKYAAFVRLGQIYSFPSDKESLHVGHLRYLWNVIANSNIGDCRIIAEITKDDSGFEKVQLDRMISNSVKREALAHQRKTVDVVAMQRREAAIEARSLLDRHSVFWCSTGIWLYRNNKEQLNQDILQLIREIPSASVERVEFGIENYWMQSLPFEWTAFLTKPRHLRRKYYSIQAISTLPLIAHEEIDRRGMMFLTRELGTPLFLDIANEKNHTGIFAKSGAGKSNIILEILIEYVVYEGVVVLFDFPRPDGTSTYTTLVPFLNELGYKAAYHDIKKSVVNVIEFPDLRFVKNAEERRERWDETFHYHVRFLSTLVLGIVENTDREGQVNSLLSQCYFDFLQNREIKQRYEEAIAGGYGSKSYQKMPILEDFVKFAKEWFFSYLAENKNLISDISRQTIDYILIQLNGVLKTSLGRAINGVSSFDTNTNLLVVGLTNVSANVDSLIYAMTGLNALYRATISRKRSLLGIDEGTILYKFKSFARETGIIPVHGRKWGCNFLVAAQEIETIRDSVVGGEIFKNFDNIFCGNIESPAIQEMLELKFEKDIVQKYTKKSFKPNKQLLQSYWYWKRGDRHIEVTHPASDLLLALGATEPVEEIAKQKIMNMYSDKFKALLFFAYVNKIVKQSGISYEFAIEKNREKFDKCVA